MSKTDILIIDDEEQIHKLLAITLRANSYSVAHAATAKEGLIMAANHPPALIMLDLGLPDKNGLVVLQELRRWYTQPIIVLSVQDSEDVIVQALDHGANDYLTKPWRNGELLARIRSAIRLSVQEDKQPIINSAVLQIDLHTRTVKKKGQLVRFTLTEYALLAIFAKNDGKVLTQQYLLRAVWGPDFINQSQYLRVFIAQIRKKIEDNPNQPKYVLTGPGIGYRFVSGRE